MKSIITILVLFFCSLNTTKASHIYGGDIGYKSLGGNTYEISLVLYGDCSGNSFPNLINSTPVIDIYNNGSLYQTISLALTGSPAEVTPVCPALANNTTCQSGTIPGITQFIFKKQITLNTTSTNWLFRFVGTMGANGGGAGRSNSITNILPPGSSNASLMNLEATLNNTIAANNSATYSTIPTPFFCINTQQEYNQGAIDGDGDILTFSLIDGLDGNSSTGYVDYVSPYTSQNPLGTSAGNFSFNNTTGQLSFFPNIVQQSLVVSKVTETRNGVVVGTSMREMTFVVLNNCNNQSPSGVVASTNIGTINAQGELEICNGDDSLLQFTIQAVDPNGDNITATVNGLPANANSSIIGNNTSNAIININFTIPNPFVTGLYNFYITYQDDACPLSSKQTKAYTIKLIQPITSTVNTINESCFPKNDGKITISATSANSGLLYSLNNGLFQNTNSFTNLTAGTYSIVLKDSKNCLYETTTTIIGSSNPTIDNLISKDIKCNGEKNGTISLFANPVNVSYTYTLLPDNIINSTGYFENLSQNNYTIIAKDNKECSDTATATISEPPPITISSVKTADLTCEKINGQIIAKSNFADSVYFFLEPGIGRNDSGIFYNLAAGNYLLSVVNNNGCKSQTNVTLNTIPKTFTISTATKDLPCQGNGTEGEAEVFPMNGTPPYSYLWTTNPVQTTAKITDLYYGFYFVNVIDATGCENNARVYINPGNCCENIYAANAFSPNGDGHNDDWGIVTSAGIEIKQFMVVNRWGQKVWQADDQRERWDGSQKNNNNRQVEIGNYYYLLKYKCLVDNKTYFKKGDITIYK